VSNPAAARSDRRNPWLLPSGVATWLPGSRERREPALNAIASFVPILAFGPISAVATRFSSPIAGLLERVTMFTHTGWMAITSFAPARRLRGARA
jgi:hypothetical protein